MNEKTAIVTGASSGFGLLSVIELAAKGFTVMATMRNTQKDHDLMELARKKKIDHLITVHPLDVTSKKSIDDFKTFLEENNSDIHVLVNNAGFALGGFSEELSVEDYREQFETNFFGVIAVTQAVLPFMRKNGYGRIINISSISGKIGFPGLSAYTSSKHALEGYSESFRLEVKPFGIDVSLVEPGSYQTNIWASVDNQEVNDNSPYASYMKKILQNIEQGKAEHGDPNEVAKLVAQIASQNKSPNLRYPIGKGVKTNIVFKNLLSWNFIEKNIFKQLFK